MRWAAVASLAVVLCLTAAASAFAAPSIPGSFRHFEISPSVFLRGEPGVRLAGKRFDGAKLKPGECGPDETHSFCSSSKLSSPIASKPALPLNAGR